MARDTAPQATGHLPNPPRPPCKGPQCSKRPGGFPRACLCPRPGREALGRPPSPSFGPAPPRGAELTYVPDTTPGFTVPGRRPRRHDPRSRDYARRPDAGPFGTELAARPTVVARHVYGSSRAAMRPRLCRFRSVWPATTRSTATGLCDVRRQSNPLPRIDHRSFPCAVIDPAASPHAAPPTAIRRVPRVVARGREVQRFHLWCRSLPCQPHLPR